MNEMMDIAPEVAVALADGVGVVALESTIISHGLPYPENKQTALALEAAIREEGAVPATIAILGGRIKIGLTGDELEELASPSSDVIKVSRRDIATIMAQGGNGATTVASTMICAAMAGILVFATGGIGGVHRGAAQDFDISADLPELARTNVAVVSAGPKAILDLPLTMEYLETHGVPVIGYGTDELPAFWSRASGISLTARADSADAVAAIMKTKWSLGIEGGMMIANPVPEADEIPHPIIAKVIDEALAEAEAEGIKGKEVTPYLLSLIRQKTDGASLACNQALVMNNARVGAKIAIAYAAIAYAESQKQA